MNSKAYAKRSEKVENPEEGLRLDPGEDWTFADRIRVLASIFDPKSERAFARRLGIGATTLQGYLNKDQMPRLDQAALISAVTGVSVGWLATGKASNARDNELNVRMLEAGLDNLTNATPDQRAAFRERIDEIRRMGEAWLDEGETSAHIVEGRPDIRADLAEVFADLIKADEKVQRMALKLLRTTVYGHARSHEMKMNASS